VSERHPLFLPLVLAGGLTFGFGLGLSGMVRPEVVLAFLQGEDLGLLFVLGGGAAVAGIGFRLLPRLADRAPLTGDAYGRRTKAFDRNVVAGGAVFGAGWGLSGICPGAAYASLGVGNWPVLWALAGMFLGAYAQARLRTFAAPTTTTSTTAD